MQRATNMAVCTTVVDPKTHITRNLRGLIGLDPEWSAERRDGIRSDEK